MQRRLVLMGRLSQGMLQWGRTLLRMIWVHLRVRKGMWVGVGVRVWVVLQLVVLLMLQLLWW